MSYITVKYRGILREITGFPAENIEADTVRHVFVHIRRNWGRAAEKEAKRMVISVNGKSISLLKKQKTPLNSGDTVTFLPVCGGG